MVATALLFLLVVSALLFVTVNLSAVVEEVVEEETNPLAAIGEVVRLWAYFATTQDATSGATPVATAVWIRCEGGYPDFTASCPAHVMITRTTWSESSTLVKYGTEYNKDVGDFVSKMKWRTDLYVSGSSASIIALPVSEEELWELLSATEEELDQLL